MFMELKRLHPDPNATLEIETRVGSINYVINKNIISPEHYSRLTTHRQSMLDLQIVNSKLDLKDLQSMPKDQARRIYAMRDAMQGMQTLWNGNQYLKDLQLRFDPTVPPDFFYSRLKLLKDGVRFMDGAVLQQASTF